MGQLANFVAFSPLAQAMKAGEISSPEIPGTALRSVLKSKTTPRLLSRRLNPYFGEWLMGWRLGWTSTTVHHVLNASETESWRSALQQHLSYLLDDQESLKE